MTYRLFQNLSWHFRCNTVRLKSVNITQPTNERLHCFSQSEKAGITRCKSTKPASDKCQGLPWVATDTDQYSSLTSGDGFCYINLFYDNFILTSLNAFSSSDLLIVWSLSKLCFLKTWKIHNYDNSSLHYIIGE